MLRIIWFYIPMGASAMLAALTHVIINGVLARSANPDVTISSYAVALSLSFLIDLPNNAIRQASSKFSRDRISFRSVSRLTIYVMCVLLAVSIGIGWTPFGGWLFQRVFGVSTVLLQPTIQVYQVLAFMYVLTAARSLFQGVIINQLRTGWMTIGMAVRVAAMFGMSWWFIQAGWTNSGALGALIFMVGILIESAVASAEGYSLQKSLPEHRESQTVRQVGQLMPFYMPLIYSNLLLAALNPAVQAALNYSADPTLAVASFAVALQLSNMVAWFCASVHQIVIQFYEQQRRNVLIVVAGLSVLSPLFLLTVSTEAGGSWLLEGVLSLKGALLDAVRMLLRLLAVQSCLAPWIDFFAGKAMLSGKTKAIVAGKFSSAIVNVGLLAGFVFSVPGLNGQMAGLVAAISAPVELLVVAFYLRRLMGREPATLSGQ
ncbi:hypothetical protein ACFFK0_07310 [Paenibacillus chartarius]|uniref:Multi antimicrobial extrusion protein MatE n=1 Tax=Paenibacillus chartarius TaxID=747481 RepID=A0ABV6DI04_9BACL